MNNHPKYLNEENNKTQDIIRGWYEDAKKQTPQSLAEFVDHLASDYVHDYGTVCHAAAAAAIAGATAIHKSDQGGLSGFQGGAVFWGFYQHWMAHEEEAPVRLTKYDEMLYPQYEYAFRSLSPETWSWLQNRAKDRLADGGLLSPLMAEARDDMARRSRSSANDPQSLIDYVIASTRHATIVECGIALTLGAEAATAGAESTRKDTQ